MGMIRAAEPADLPAITDLDRRLTGETKATYWQQTLERYAGGPPDRHFLVAETETRALAGFAVVLAASSALEALRMHTLSVSLPLAPGGVSGDVSATLIEGTVGFTGGTLLLVTLFAISIPESPAGAI